MTTPLSNPRAYDYILLDGQPTPGLCLRGQGGDRTQKEEDQQAPGFGGAFTVFRFQEISKIEYRFRVWTDADYLALVALCARLNAGAEKRPPRTYALLDLYLVAQSIKTVAVVSVGKIEKVDGMQMWESAVRWTEYKKLKPIGGPVSPKPTNPVEEKIAAKAAENKGLDQRLAALEQQLAGAKAAKAGGG